MSLPLSAKIEGLSIKLREDMLFPSGGWMGELIPMVSDALGVWDLLILLVLFILSWIVLRISDPLTSLILGLAFDVTIPLQHKLNPSLVDRHQAHLQGYWPIQAFAMGLEALCFFMVIPELFTLIVCLKTLIMTSIWLGKRSDGSFLTERAGAGQGGGHRSTRPGKSEEKPLRQGEPPAKQNREKAEKPDGGKQGRPRDPSAPSAPEKDKKGRPTAESEKERSRKLRNKLPETMRPAHDPLSPGFAPPGRGPPISRREAKEDMRKREKRRKAQGKGVKPKLVRLGKSSRSPGSAASESSDAHPDGRPKWHYPKGWRHGGRYGSEVGRAGQRPPPPARLIFSSISQTDSRTILIDPADDWWQCPIMKPATTGSQQQLKTRQEKKASTTTAPWEKALPHDSVDLLNWYLKRMGIDWATRGWMLMDLLCDVDEPSITRTAQAWKEAYDRNDRETIVSEPYRRLAIRPYGWRPNNGFWGSAEIAASGAKVGSGEMDEFLWALRAAKVTPAVRHAILRDLMSTPDRETYDHLKETILETFHPTQQTDIRLPTPARTAAVYQEMNNFAGMFHLSSKQISEEYHRMKAAGHGKDGINAKLQILRWACVEPVPKRSRAVAEYHDTLREEMWEFGVDFESFLDYKSQLVDWRELDFDWRPR